MLSSYEVMYIELKTGYKDNGPAWIGKVKWSKSGSTAYFNNKALKKHNGVSGNYLDIQICEEYWISGIKKDGHDRHWAGKGKIVIDRKIIDEYLAISRAKELDMRRFIIQDIEDGFPEAGIFAIENAKKRIYT